MRPTAKAEKLETGRRARIRVVNRPRAAKGAYTRLEKSQPDFTDTETQAQRQRQCHSIIGALPTHHRSIISVALLSSLPTVLADSDPVTVSNLPVIITGSLLTWLLGWFKRSDCTVPARY